jgi:DNA-binding YbaB/EbfC family protein
MFNKLKQFKDMRDQAKHLQEELSKESVTTQAAGNKVILTMNGTFAITGLAIDDTLLSPAQKDTLTKALKDAHSDALKKIQRTLAAKMQHMGGLPKIPGLTE